MADREVKVKVKLIGEQVGVDPNSKLAELTKRVQSANADLEGSYKQLSREEVDNALASEKLTEKKSKLLAAFKGLRNDVPGLGLILNALKNPLTAIAAGFALAKSAVDAYTAKVNEAFARQQAVTRAMEGLDFTQIARDSAKAAAEWATQINEVASASQRALKQLDELKTMSEGRSGILGKVAQARARSEIAAVQEQVDSGAMSKEEGARRIAAINARAERETQAAQRQGVREQVGAIDQQTATLEARRAGLLKSAPTDKEMEVLRMRASMAATRKEAELPGIEEQIKQAKDALAESDAFLASRGPISGFVQDAKNLLLPSFMGGGPTEAKRNRDWRGWLQELERDREITLGTASSEAQALAEAEARRANIGREVGEIDKTLGSLRGRRQSILTQQGLAESESAALRPFVAAENEVGFRRARGQDMASLAQKQAQANAAGGEFLSGLRELIDQQVLTMEQARDIIRRGNSQNGAGRINDQ